MSGRRATVWTLVWRWAVQAAHWLNGSADARPVEPLSRCAYDQMMVVMAN